MSRYLSHYIFFLFVLLAPLARSDLLTLTYFQTDARYTYRIELLTLALDKTEKEFGPYQLDPLEMRITQGRGIRFLESNSTVDIAFLATTREREEKLLPVKVPILRGILGYRVMLIKQEKQPRFSAIETLDQLREQLVGGFGAHWADLKILEDNGLNIMKSTNYENLFSMLRENRFDYFPRGLNEAWGEVERHPELAVEQELALYYPYPVYFFVNKTQKMLAHRIGKGLDIALQEGSFKTLFLKHHQGLVEQANLAHRRMFVLENTTLPEGTPHPDTSWWLQ